MRSVIEPREGRYRRNGGTIEFPAALLEERTIG